MTRKDYELIAAAFRETRTDYGSLISAHTLEVLSRALAHKLAADNARFDRARFVAACVAQ